MHYKHFLIYNKNLPNGPISQFSSTKFNKFLAKIQLPFLLRWSFLIPRCSSFILSLDIKLIFFCRQKFFNRELVSARVCSKFFLSFRKMILEKVRTVLRDVVLVLLTIFFTFDNRFISFVWSFVPCAFCLTHHQFSLRHLSW